MFYASAALPPHWRPATPDKHVVLISLDRRPCLDYNVGVLLRTRKETQMKTSTKIAVIRPDGPNYAVVVSLHEYITQANAAIERNRRHDNYGALTQSGTNESIEDVSADAQVGDRFRYTWV